MWDDIKQRVEELKTLDTNHHCLGATQHRYEAGPLLTPSDIKKHEHRLKCELPEQLKTYYLEVGNGGYGPDYGIWSIEKIIPYKPDQEWRGLKYYGEADEPIAEVASGMLAIMERYYAHEGCIVTNGPDVGKFIEFSPSGDWNYLGSHDLLSVFSDWLDHRFESFNRYKRVLSRNENILDLLEDLHMTYGTSHHSALAGIASLIELPFNNLRDAHNVLTVSRDKQSEFDAKLTKSAEKQFNDELRNYLSIKSNLTLSKTEKTFTYMKFLAIDVDYRDGTAYVAGVSFSDTSDQIKSYESTVSNVADYKSGEFYKRELPCILALLNEHDLKPDCIVVDGYVHLENGKPGLGMHLFEALYKEVIVIGVAKNPRGNAMEELEVYRGGSKNPLYVTSEGIELNKAKKIVKDMSGPYRMPKALKYADSMCRQQ